MIFYTSFFCILYSFFGSCYSLHFQIWFTPNHSQTTSGCLFFSDLHVLLSRASSYHLFTAKTSLRCFHDSTCSFLHAKNILLSTYYYVIEHFWSNWLFTWPFLLLDYRPSQSRNCAWCILLPQIPTRPLVYEKDKFIEGKKGGMDRLMDG